MFAAHRFFGLFGVALLLLALAVPASAQDPDRLVMGQPVAVTLSTAGETARLAYTLSEARAVSLQAISQTAQPTLAVLRDGTLIAEQPNPEGALIVPLNAFLPAGDYVVEVGARNGTTGSILVAVQGEMPVTPFPLAAASPIQGVVTVQSPVAVYTFSALPELAYLYAGSLLPDVGVQVRVRNLTTGRLSAAVDPDLLGARLVIPAGNAAFQLEISHGGFVNEQPFSVCFSAISADACAGGTPPATSPEQPQTSAACTVTPQLAGGANIRQTTSIDAPAVIALPGGAIADAIGISPDGQWYQVSYSGVTGWTAVSAVTASGLCDALVVMVPPPTPAPLLPSATPMPTQPPMPTQTPAPTTTPTPSGPCLVSFTAEELLYIQPEALPDYIFDEISAGGEILPVARWDSNPSWYKTAGGIWWPNAPGTSAILSGDCGSLPLVSWP